jgi:hypothetical protein
MIPQSGSRFSDKIMRKSKAWSAMLIPQEIIALQRGKHGS